jgi:hypothetical protein
MILSDIGHRRLWGRDTDLLHFSVRVLRGERQLLLLGVHFPVPEPCCVRRPTMSVSKRKFRSLPFLLKPPFSQNAQARVRGVRWVLVCGSKSAGEKKHGKGREGQFSLWQLMRTAKAAKDSPPSGS